MNDEELGLPKPKKYEGERFTVKDYKTEEYASARTLSMTRFHYRQVQ